MYACRELGHIVAQCPNAEEPMQCNLGNWEDQCILIHFVGIAVMPHKYTRPMKLNGVETMALVDSGSANLLISGKLVKCSQLMQAKCTGVTCVPGAVSYYPTIPAKIEIQGNITGVPIP